MYLVGLHIKNQAVLSLPELHHFLKEKSQKKKGIKNLTAKLSQELDSEVFCYPLCYFEMFH